jgi:hypothetical protein
MTTGLAIGMLWLGTGTAGLAHWDPSEGRVRGRRNTGPVVPCVADARAQDASQSSA